MASVVTHAGARHDVTLSASGSYVIYELDRFVRSAGLSVYPANSGTYLAQVSNSSLADIEADNAVWHDLFGDGSTPQTLSRAIELADASWQAVKVSKQSGAAGTVKVSIVIKRNLHG